MTTCYGLRSLFSKVLLFIINYYLLSSDNRRKQNEKPERPTTTGIYQLPVFEIIYRGMNE